VEVRYRPIVDEDVDQVQAVVQAVDELSDEGPGDVLVFLSGEREIRDTADALKGSVAEGTEVVPLFARLSAAEQHRVFSPHPGRRIVLATNVAETSLTVPGIRYVVDPGTARISRYSQRTKVQRLPIEAISQASATQRAGRCGRVAPGICIRLYEEEDLLARPEFTDPEILRTNLASVILQMTALGLGDVEAFPFVDPPDRRNVKDGVDLLVELGALDPAREDPRKRLTPIGRKLAQLPIDPRLGGWCWPPTTTAACGTSSSSPRAVHPGPSRAPAGPPAGGGGGAQPVRRRDVGLPRLPQPVALPAGLAEGAVQQRLPPAVQEGVPQLPAGAGVAGPAQPAPPLAAPARAVAGQLGDQRRRRAPVAARRPAQPRRAAGHREARVPRRPQCALGAGAVLVAGQEGAALGDGRRAGRDQPHVGPGRRPGRPGLGGAGRLAPGQAAVLRAALGAQGRGGDGVRAGDPLRHPGRRAAQGQLRVDRAGAVPRDVPAVRAGRGGLGHLSRVLRREPALLDDVEELEHRARRRDIVVDDQALYDFYDARIPRTSSAAGTSTPGGSGPGTRRRTCSPSPSATW
jgi:ATP-dependent helicase HrpA